MNITPSDRDSPVWRALMTYLGERVEALRRQNDTDHTPEQTSKLRGQILELNTLLKLDKERPIVK